MVIKNILGIELPENLDAIIIDYQWINVDIGCSKTKVFKLSHKENQTKNLYLKINTVGTGFNLENEKIILEWIGSKLPVPKVIYFSNQNGNEFLLQTEIKGKVAYEAKSSTQKRRNIRILAEGLKKIHELDYKDCPIKNSPEKFLKIGKERMLKGLVQTKEFDNRWNSLTPKSLYDQILRIKPSHFDYVFCHGDYCLPNIIINEGKLSGFIDWVYGGISDRYQDLAAVIWSIGFNFGEKWIKYFIQDYGLEELDYDRIKFHQMLSEFYA